MGDARCRCRFELCGRRPVERGGICFHPGVRLRFLFVRTLLPASSAIFLALSGTKALSRGGTAGRAKVSFGAVRHRPRGDDACHAWDGRAERGVVPPTCSLRSARAAHFRRRGPLLERFPLNFGPLFWAAFFFARSTEGAASHRLSAGFLVPSMGGILAPRTNDQAVWPNSDPPRPSGWFVCDTNSRALRASSSSHESPSRPEIHTG